MAAINVAFHHMGLALADDERAVAWLSALGYSVGERVYDDQQNVNLRMCTHALQPGIEIVLPGDGDGPLTPILKRFNELIYHVCYEVPTFDTALDEMDAAGMQLIPVAPPKPAILFGGRQVAFFQVRGFGLIELLER